MRFAHLAKSEAVLQTDLDDAHHTDIGKAVVAYACAVLVVQRRSREVGVSGRKSFRRVEKREAFCKGSAVRFVLDRGVDDVPPHLVEGVVEGPPQFESMTLFNG